MSEQDDRALVQLGYEAFGRGDNGSPQDPLTCPTAGHRRGRQQVAEFFQ